jgi:lysophospholipase L1-like esterase
VRPFANAALAALSLAAALAGAELALRGLGLAPRLALIDTRADDGAYQRSADPLLGFELKAGYRGDAFPFRTNAHGQRDLERALAKPAGVTRVLLLGDSVVEGWGLSQLDDTLSRRLEALHPDGSLEVLNFGVSGYSTRAEVRLLEIRGLAFAPDAVVLLFVENDFHNLNRDLYAWRERPRPDWVRWAFPRSALFRLLALRLDLWGLGSQLDPARGLRGSDDNLVVEGVARLAELAEREGFAPLVAIWPRFTDARITDAAALPARREGGRHELVIERLAALHGIESVRLSDAFRRDWRERPARGGETPVSRYTLADGMHPTPTGTAVAARGLDEALAGLAGRPRPAPQRRPDDAQVVALARELGRVQPDAQAWHEIQAKALDAAGRLAGDEGR